MKRTAITLGPLMLVLGLFLSSCSGIRPLHKGETARCETCGTVNTADTRQDSP